MVFKAVDARKILGLSSNFTARELKMAYYKKALLHHPDKNPDGEEEFKRINKAYELLQKGEGCGVLNYNDMIKKFIFYVYPEWDEMFIDTTIKSIIRNLETFSYKIFNNISKERSVEIYKFLLLLPISDIIKEKERFYYYSVWIKYEYHSSYFDFLFDMCIFKIQRYQKLNYGI